MIERYRKEGEMDKLMWFCEKCAHKLHEATFPMTIFVNQLPVIMNAFFADEDLQTCKECGTVMEKP